MHLYIDANVFLDFFHMTSTDIEELKKLVALIQEKQIVLYIPEQTIDEIIRNRDSKISDALDVFQKANVNIKFPAFLKSFDEYEELRRLINEVNKKHAELFKKAKDAALSGGFEADDLIENLLNASKFVEIDDVIFDRAYDRFYRGNPPGKGKGPIGDEINWESLKCIVPDGVDLYIVSKDKDYSSVFNHSRINEFLKKEWKEDKRSDVYLYVDLTSFFKDKYPSIKLASDVVVSKLIDRLSASRNFATTHDVISSLDNIEYFNSVQVERLIDIAYLNSQVGWIIDDSDVNSFYQRLLNDHCKGVSDESISTLKGMLKGVEAIEVEEGADSSSVYEEPDEIEEIQF